MLSGFTTLLKNRQRKLSRYIWRAPPMDAANGGARQYRWLPKRLGGAYIRCAAVQPEVKHYMLLYILTKKLCRVRFEWFRTSAHQECSQASFNFVFDSVISLPDNVLSANLDKAICASWGKVLMYFHILLRTYTTMCSQQTLHRFHKCHLLNTNFHLMMGQDTP